MSFRTAGNLKILAITTGFTRKGIDMASVSIRGLCERAVSDIDYSTADGRVRQLLLRGELLYDERDKVEVDGWKDKLVEFVREAGLDVDHDGHGLHSFVHRMRIDGIL